MPLGLSMNICSHLQCTQCGAVLPFLGQHLDEVGGQGDAGLGIDNGGALVVDEVGAHHGVFRVPVVTTSQAAGLTPAIRL